jgi:chemotaxis protein MotB
MARKKAHEEHVNAEAWAIPYADLLVLLLAFFVVLYSISAVNEGKYRVLSDSMVAAFRATPKSPEPIQIGETMRARREVGTETITPPIPLGMSQMSAALTEEPLVDELRPDLPLEAMLHLAGLGADDLADAMSAMSEMADQIEEAMSPLIEDELIKVNRNRFWLEVEINTSILYASGSARLSPQAIPVLEQLAEILRRFPNRIHVEGHTDTVPINTPVFPSNWELSSGRAASVVHLFTRNGVDPANMAAIGYGEYRPLAENTTAEGRQRNRRVVIVVLAGRRAPREQAEGATMPELLREDMEAIEREMASPMPESPVIEVPPAQELQ